MASAVINTTIHLQANITLALTSTVLIEATQQGHLLLLLLKDMHPQLQACKQITFIRTSLQLLLLAIHTASSIPLPHLCNHRNT